MNGEDEKTWEERRSRNEVLETVSHEMSPVVPITLKTYTVAPRARQLFFVQDLRLAYRHPFATPQEVGARPQGWRRFGRSFPRPRPQKLSERDGGEKGSLPGQKKQRFDTHRGGPNPPAELARNPRSSDGIRQNLPLDSLRIPHQRRGNLNPASSVGSVLGLRPGMRYFARRKFLSYRSC